jgi:mercuric reductase
MTARRTWTLNIEGMTCHHCAVTIDAALKRIPGVVKSATRFPDGEAQVIAEETVDGAALAEAVSATGYRVVGLHARVPRADAGSKEADADVAILVNEYLETTRPGVYAAGVIGDPMFVYGAAYAGSVAAENALRGNTRRYELSVVPRVTFTDPAVASVGLTEAQARERGRRVAATKLPLSYVPRALAARDTRGFIKLIADEETNLFLGAHILAAEAGEMIQPLAMAIRFGIRVEDVASMLHPYLTHAEGIKLAAQTFKKDVAKLSCCAA